MNRRHRCYLFPVRSACNADCRFCFVKDLRSPEFLNQPTTLSLEALRKVVHRLDIHNITEVEITGGGEPTLHPDLQTIIDLVGVDRKIKLYTNGMRPKLLRGVDELNISRCHWDTTVNNEIYRCRQPTGLDDALEFYRPLVRTMRLQVLLLRGYIDTPELMLEFVERYGDRVDQFMFRTLFSRSQRCTDLYTEAELIHPKVKMDLTSDNYVDCWSINTAGKWTDGMPW